MPDNKPLCNHPELQPTDFNQEKPEPAEMITCECGKNATCPVCGFGWGNIPCDCRPMAAIELTTTSWEKALDWALVEYAPIWERLAEM